MISARCFEAEATFPSLEKSRKLHTILSQGSNIGSA